MLFHTASLIISLAIILLGCELFTNSIEWLGIKLHVGDGVVGSIFSAVGTCLPETMIPIIAILFSDNKQYSDEIAIGAIVGAPFMLSTLAFFVAGLSAILFENKRRSGMRILADKNILRRDLRHFIAAYSLGAAAAFIDDRNIKNIIAFSLIVMYMLYLVKIIRNDKKGSIQPDKLYFSASTGRVPAMTLVIIQIVLALIGIIIGAKVFVGTISQLALRLKIPVMVLTLVIAPVATELPEKFNSIIWIKKRKDILALGNITGAMVFQSCLPVAIGISSTQWKLDGIAIICIFQAIASAVFLIIWLRCNKNITPTPFITGGLLYFMYIIYLIQCI